MTVRWQTNTDIPVSTEFDDTYFSFCDGFAETEHVFINGNNLRERWRYSSNFYVNELGFGTGLNALITWYFFRQDNPTGHLHFTSYEKNLLSFADISRALRPFKQLATHITILQELLHNDEKTTTTIPIRYVHVPGFTLQIVIGDANETIHHHTNKADAWYLDGFSPAKNPELWNLPLIQYVYNLTRTGGTFSTYTAAGWVRNILQTTGFDVTRTRGFRYKRHMTTGRKLCP